MARLLLAGAWLAGASAAGGELRLDARELAALATLDDVRLAADAAAIELATGQLIEDDGPAAGFSYQPNEERLTERVWARKELHVADPAARAATLLIGSGSPLKVSVNGRAAPTARPGKAGNYWQTHALPVDWLRPGSNEIVLAGPGRLWIARGDDFSAGSIDRPHPPGRSARSTDGGMRWERNRLGPAGDLTGEYCVRLFLDQHRAAGALVLPAFDLGNLARRPIAPPIAGLAPVQFTLEADTTAGTTARIRVRTGPSPAQDDRGWSAWRVLDRSLRLDRPTGRYLQAAVELSTSVPLATPRVRSLRIASAVAPAGDWADQLAATALDLAPIVRTSIPFQYEPFDHPHLKELRARERLDDVIRGAATELELVERLAVWSASRWERGHLKEGFPPWDALEILKPHADGTPTGGFCLQYNLVLLQACASVGIPGRVVSIGPGDHGSPIRGGHEVIEIWSNQFRKWMYVDGNMAWYARDLDSGTPLSLRELRERQLPILQGKPPGAIRVVHLRASGQRWEGLQGWPAFLELRMVPRSNFLAERRPLPLHQGMRGWFWTGHHVWTDAAAPASLLYGQRVAEGSAWDWPLNRTQCILEAAPTPGELRVHLDTVTPGFDTFLADVDRAGAKPAASGFAWKLRPGKNVLEVRSRNRAGRAGIPARVTVDYPG